MYLKKKQPKCNFYKINLLLCAYFLNLSTLIDRRSLLLSKFLRNLILGSNDCSELLALPKVKINPFNTQDPKPGAHCIFGRA